MPIVVPVPDPEAPLSQGDILKGVPLFRTSSSEPAAAVACASPFCLVISRPCVTLHKGRIVVAEVAPYAKERPQFETFDEAKEFYDDVRDGKSSPDRFYLGQLDGQRGSFCARLDSLHTIEVPEAEALRRKYVADRRVAQLDPAFARDLHGRLFRAFASLGFDDHAWYSTADLEVLVTLGEKAVAIAESEYSGAKARMLAGQSQAYNKPGEEKGLENAVEKQRLAVEKVKAELQPLKDELTRRRNGANEGN